MKKTTCTTLAVLLGCLLAFSARAQQPQWEALNKQLLELYQAGKYQDGMRVAEEALEVAKKTFGPTHFNVASS